jgi:hypothetical protein
MASVDVQLMPPQADVKVLLGKEDYEVIDMPAFDPTIHLAFQPPVARHSFTELGLKKPAKAPDMCYTEPFQLFSEEGVRMIRRDLLRKEVLDKHLNAWDRAPCYIGGHEEVCENATFHVSEAYLLRPQPGPLTCGNILQLLNALAKHSVSH